MQRPQPDEYAEYYRGYVDQVPDGDIVELLEAGMNETADLLAGVDEARALHRYAAGKWSIKELVGHVVDTERLFGYRAVSFARNDKTALPGIDQDLWVAGASFDARTLPSLVRELRGLRESHLAMFSEMDDETSRRRGVASGVEFSVRAFAWILAGHEIHHRKILRDRYL